MSATAISKGSQRPLTPPANGQRPRRPSTGRSRTKFRRGIFGIIILLALWEAASRIGIVEERFLPGATTVLLTLIERASGPAFWVAVRETLTAWGLGLMISLIAGTILGFLVGRSRVLRHLTHSTVEFVRPIPSVALIPLVVLVFGVQIESELMLVIYACFWPVFIQVIYGTADVDNVAMQTSRSYGLGKVASFRYVVFPTTLPFLMTGIRLAATVALILAVTAELVIGTNGIGHEIALTRSGGMVASMYALVLTTGIIGVAINVVLRWVERKVLSWHESVRSELPS